LLDFKREIQASASGGQPPQNGKISGVDIDSECLRSAKLGALEWHGATAAALLQRVAMVKLEILLFA
jgi:hypothetical protein